jgi:hypothetical protein
MLSVPRRSGVHQYTEWFASPYQSPRRLTACAARFNCPGAPRRGGAAGNRT